MIPTTYNQKPLIKDDVDSDWKEELSKPLNLSEIEKKVIPKLRLLSLGMIPLQGYSLFKSSHHYDYQSMKAFTAVEKQVWDSSVQFSWWWKEDVHALRDALWHKAGHPVKISFKKEMASSTTVKQLLVEAGVTSASAWLPFLEAEVRKANTYITLFETLLPIFKSRGVELTWDTLDEMLVYLENFPVARPEEMVTVNNAPSHLRSLNTREKVVTWIEQWCTRNAGKVAMYFGFYMAMAERSAQFDGPHTLKTSYSLVALKKAKFGNYYLGLELFADYAAYKAKKLSQARTQ